jgi:hypothetical protein
MRVLTRRSAAAVAATTLVLTGATACGSNAKKSAGGDASTEKVRKAAKNDPKRAFTDALAKFSVDKGASITIKVAATKDELLTLARADSTFSKADEKAVGYLSGATITIKTRAKATDFAVNLDGEALLEFVGTAKKDLYLRADVRKIASLAGQDSAKLESLTGSLPPTFSFVKDAIAGRWLKLDGAAVEQLANLAKAQAGAKSSLSPADGKGLQERLVAGLRDNFTVKDAGSTDKGEHLILTGNTKKLAAALTSIAGSIPGAGALAGKKDLTNVADKDVTVDAYVTDGGLSALQLDLAQFASKDKAALAGKHVPLEISFAPGPDSVAVPATSVPVDLNALLSGVLGGGFGKLGGAGATS